MFSLVYVSAAVTWFSDRELRGLLAQCRLSNAQTGITGMLLYKDGNFMQTLEGDERTVRALEARIAELRIKYADDQEASALLDQIAEEPEMHRRHSGYYAYEFFVARRCE